MNRKLQAYSKLRCYSIDYFVVLILSYLKDDRIYYSNFYLTNAIGSLGASKNIFSKCQHTENKPNMHYSPMFRILTKNNFRYT